MPDIALPADWKVRDLAAGLTLDEIELNLDKTETHKTLAAETQEGMRNVLDQLDGRGTDPAMSRTLRKLTIPEEVLLVYKGNTTNSQTTMQRLADNEYTGQFGDLKEIGRLHRAGSRLLHGVAQGRRRRSADAGDVAARGRTAGVSILSTAAATAIQPS